MEKQYVYVMSLSRDIKESIKDYTGSEYEYINQQLRTHRPLTFSQKEIVDNIDKAFVTVPPIEEPTVVYRGIKDKYIPDLHSFISTSFDVDATHKFRGRHCCVLRILLPVGSKILPIKEISDHPDEKEVLIGRFGKLNVTGKEYRDGMEYYDVVYIPEVKVEIVDPSLENINELLSVETWISRLNGILSEEDIQIFGLKDAVYNIVETTFTNQRVPLQAIEAVLKERQ